MKGYKGFSKDLTCRDFKYEVGKTYEMEEKPIVCERGFHFCKELKNVFGYYDLYKDNAFCEIEAYGDIITEDVANFYEKYCTNKIKIIRELSLDEILDIINIKDKETFIRCYDDDRFDEDQIRIIGLGLEKGFDVNIYAKPEFTVYQMSYIYYGLLDGLDVSAYAKPEFNLEQMYVIYLGLRSGLDVSTYAKPEFDWSQMHKMYLELLKENKDVN